MNYFELLLQIANKAMDKIPDYDQVKKSQWSKLLTAYNEEKVKPYPERDDDKLMNLRDSLKDFLTVFNKELDQNATTK